MAGWSNLAASGSADIDVSMAVLTNGLIIVAGGSSKILKKYDPLTNTWTTGAALPANVSQRGVNIVGIPGNLLFLTGGSFYPTFSVGTYTYDPTANTYTAKANAPLNTWHSNTVTDGTAVYIMGGQNADQGAHLGVRKWTIATNTWTSPSTTINPGNPAFTFSGGSGGLYYGGKIFHWYGYYDIATNAFTTYSTNFVDNVAAMPRGKPYLGKYAIVVSEDWQNVSANRNRVSAWRDLSVAPYTLNSTKIFRTGDPLASTYGDRSKFLNDRYFYLHGGQRRTSPYTIIDLFHVYDMDLEWPVTTATPNNGATFSTDLPTVTAQIVDNGEEVYVHFQFAKDAAFTNTVKDFYYTDSQGADRRIYSGVISQKTPLSAELSTGTWYYRVRVENGPSASSWSTATRQFTVTHPPSASLTFPINGKGMTYGNGDVTFQWNFSDTSETDTQTAYQLVLERNDTGALLLDTGKITSTAKQHTFNIPASHKDFTLRWKVSLWDSDNVQGSFSAYNTFSISDAPVVTITSPTNGGTVNTGTPTVTWTIVASNRTQRSYQVRFYNALGVMVHDSGKVISTALSYTPPSQILGVGDASVTVDLEDSTFLTGTDTNTFTAIFDEPPQPAFNVESSSYESLGYIRVTWDSANRDSSFVEYRVYRREEGALTWDLLYTTNDNVATDFTFDDYTANSNKTYEYAVVQAGFRNDTIVESQKTNTFLVTASSTQYWLVDNANPERNTLIPNVTSDSFTDEYEQQTLKVIGRGNHVDYGTRWGYVGSLSAQLRGENARLYRLQLEYLRSLRVEMILRNPFGDTWRVATGNIQVDRLSGVGITEMSDVTIPYEEVS